MFKNPKLVLATVIMLGIAFLIGNLISFIGDAIQ